MKTKTVTVEVEFQNVAVSPCFGCPAQASGTLQAECHLVFGGEEIEAGVPDHWEIESWEVSDLVDLQLWLDYDWSGEHCLECGGNPNLFCPLSPGGPFEEEILNQPIGQTASRVYGRWPHDPNMTRWDALREHLLDVLNAEISEKAIEIAERDE